MKSNTIVQSLLGLAVIILFILHFQQPTSTVTQTDTSTNLKDSISEPHFETTPSLDTEVTSNNKLAYVNIDSLNLQYDFVDQLEAKFKRKSLAEQKKLEAEGKALQEEYMMFVKQAQAGMLQQEQAMQMEQDFKERQMKLMQKEQQTGMNLEMEHMESNKEIMQKVSKYLDSYAKENNFDVILAYGSGAGVLYAKQGLDITNDVVKGLNEELKTK